MNDELINFIYQHKLEIVDFFDANGKTVKSCYNEMKLQDKIFAFNTTPCSNHGHTTRDRQGHCIMCNTANISFSLRKKKIGFIYIACSLKKEISKVGMTTENIESRLSKLNSRKVGNTDDWKILYSIKCAKVNSVELLLHKGLKKYQIKGNYYGTTESKEIFRCSYHKAKELLERTIENNNIKIIEKKSYSFNKEKYQFRNLITK